MARTTWRTYEREEGEGYELSQTGIVKAYRLRDQRPNFELNMRKQRSHGGSRTEHTVGRSRQMGRAFLFHVKFRPCVCSCVCVCGYRGCKPNPIPSPVTAIDNGLCRLKNRRKRRRLGHPPRRAFREKRKTCRSKRRSPSSN